MPGLSADFREEKRIALLRDPIESQGSIYFARPDRLARHTRTPIRSVVLLIGDVMSYQYRGERSDFGVDSHPMIRGMSNIFRLLLAGDGDGLQANFEVTTETDEEDRWQITLHPRPGPMRDAISEIRVRGTEAVLTELHVKERSGDETTTSFSAVDTQRHFSASEAEQIFRLPDP